LIIELLTWDEHNINDGENYATEIAEAQMLNLSAEATFSDRTQMYPYLSGSKLPAHFFSFRIQMKGTDRSAQQNELAQWFDVTDPQPKILVGANDSTGQWYLEGKPIQVLEDEGNLVLITLALSDPLWKKVDIDSDIWYISATGATKTYPVRGNYRTQPTITIMPTGARTGSWLYKWWRPIYQPATMTVPLVRYPLTISGAAWDTDALVDAGKMLASGDDLRVMVDAHETERWLDGIDDTVTKVWVNLDFSIPIQLTLAANLANSGTVETIYVGQDLDLLIRLAGANNKTVLIGDEAFTFDDIDPIAFTLTGCARAAKGTSMAAHTAGDKINWIEHDIWIIYGNAAAAPPIANDANKPLIDLHDSTNESWVYANLYDADSARPCAWAGGVVMSQGKLSYIYTGDELANANPSTFMGMAMLAWVSSAMWKAETAELSWLLYHPCGITDISYDGDKYALLEATSGITTERCWPSTAGCQASVDGKIWTTVFADAAPTVKDTWQSLTHALTSLGATNYWIKFIFKGSLIAGINNLSALQIENVVISLDDTRIPVVEDSAGELTNYQMHCYITNNVTDEYIFVSYTMELNTYIEIDCEAKTAKYSDGSNIFSALQFSSIRPNWLDIGPGDVEIQFDDPGTTAVTVVISWQDRVQ
jgi:hypothetical protein